MTAGAVVFDGSTVVEVEFFCYSADVWTTASSFLAFVLYDGASSIGLFAFLRGPAGTGEGYVRAPINVRRRLTPSSASHTYSVRAYVSGGTGNAYAGAGGSGNAIPGFIRIVPIS